MVLIPNEGPEMAAHALTRPPDAFCRPFQGHPTSPQVPEVVFCVLSLGCGKFRVPRGAEGRRGTVREL